MRWDTALQQLIGKGGGGVEVGWGVGHRHQSLRSILYLKGQLALLIGSCQAGWFSSVGHWCFSGNGSRRKARDWHIDFAGLCLGGLVA